MHTPNVLAPRRAAERRPKFFLISTDGQRWDAIGAVQRKQAFGARVGIGE